MSARQLLQLDHDFVMKGGRLNRPALAYETWGTLNARRDNCVLLFTGLSPSAMLLRILWTRPRAGGKT